MLQIPLSSIPSPDLTVTLDGAYWRLSFFLSINFVCVDIERNGTRIVSGARCFVGQPLMPYKDMYAPDFGNFVFDNEVDWEKFGDSCNLYYLNKDEFAQYQELFLSGMEMEAIKNIAARASLFDEQYKASLSSVITPINIPRVKITKEPSDQSIIETLAATFVLEADNASSYQWEYSPQEEGVPWSEIVGANGPSYTVPVVNRLTMGYYRCVARGSSGVDVSRSALLAISNVRPPVFTGQPQNSKVVQGSSAQLFIAVMYADRLQWERSTDQVNWVAIPGATTSALSIASVDASTAGYFRVRAYGAGSTMVLSAVAHVEYGSLPVFSTQPVAVKLKGGQPLNLSVVVSGATSVSWSFSKNGTSNWVPVQGANGQSLSITRPTASDVGYYRATATNQFGSVSSSMANVDVVELPVIIATPQNQNIAEGSQMFVEVQASGFDSVKWEISKNNGTTWTTIPSETSPSIGITSVNGDSEGIYRATFTNFAGSVSTQFKLSVMLTPVFLSQPSDVKIAEGGTLVISAVVQNATGFEWESSGDGQQWTTIPGQTTATLRLVGAISSDSKFYRLTAIGAAVNVKSNVVSAMVVSKPRFLTQLIGQQVNERDPFTVSFDQAGAESIVWEKSVDNFATWNVIPGVTSNVYTVASAGPSDAANYRVTLKNFAGTAIAQFSVGVTLYPVFSVQPLNAKLRLGESLSLNVAADPSERYSWEWSVDGSSWTAITNSTGQTLNIASPAVDRSGQYRAKAYNKSLSTKSNSAVVEIIALPEITKQLQSIQVDMGNPFTLSVVASGQDSVKWEKSIDGVSWSVMPGEVGLSYSVASAGESDMAEYRVTLTNYAGSVSSSGAVDVVMAPVILTQPVGATVAEFDQFSIFVDAKFASSYQWERSYISATEGFSPVPGRDLPTFEFESITFGERGFYRVVIKNGKFTTISDVVELTVVQLPFFAAPLNSAQVSEGTSLLLRCSPFNQDSISWDFSVDGVDWHTLPGASEREYRVASASAADVGHYRVTLSNIAGTATSTSTVEVALNPVITQQPITQRVAAGSQVVFSCDADNATVYSWRKSKQHLPPRQWVDVPGNSKSLTIDNAQPGEFVNFQCIVRNVTSFITLQRLTTIAAMDVVVQPVVISSPAGGEFVAGNELTLKVEQTGAETIEWSTSKDGGNSWTKVNVGGFDTYTIPSLSLADSGMYRITLTNIAGTVTIDFSLAVYAIPVFSSQPADSATAVGGDITLTSAASPVTGVQWQYSTDGVSFTDLAGETSNTLALIKPPVTASGKYRLKANNHIATAYSSVANVVIAALPVITSQPKNVTTRDGDPATFTVVGTGYDSVKWESKTLSGEWTVEAETGPTLTIAHTSAADQQVANMTYRATLINAVGSKVSSNAYLSVMAYPVSTATLPDRTFRTGAPNRTFQATFDKVFAFTTYQWYALLGPVGTSGGFTPVAGQTTDKLTIAGALTKASNGEYFCKATNASGSVKAEGQTNSFRISAVDAPLITKPLPDATVAVGDRLLLAIEDNNDGTNGAYTYVWEKYDGLSWQVIPGVTGQSLYFGSIATSDAGSYRVTITNVIGNMSSNCTVTVS